METSREVRSLLPALLVVLIIVGGYFWWKNHNPRSSAPVETETPTTTPVQKENVEVSRPDISAGSNSKLPAGFPSNIPLEEKSITESYKAYYENHAVTQYTVSYKSSESKDAIYKIYTSFFSAQGYALDTKISSLSKGILRATKGNNELDVAITTAGSGSYVQLNYIQR